MDVMSILDKLDAYLSECSRVPLVGKLMVDEEEVFNLIDDLRAAIPQELEQARWLLKERERMLQDARKEAEEIIKDAQGQIASLASESVIAKEARAQAEEIMQKAREVAKEINFGARQYADDVMGRVETLLTELIEAIKEGRKELDIEQPKTLPQTEVQEVRTQEDEGEETTDDAQDERGDGEEEEDTSRSFLRSKRKRARG